jgi:ribosomal protein L16 Arg81 hydroxylase
MTGSPWPHISTSTVFLHGVYEHCPIDDESKQMEYITQSSYPSLANAWPHRMEIVLKAGEALLIPARWWHMTEILEAGSAVNWWFHVDPAIESKINERLMKMSSKDASSETAPLKDDKCIIS